MVYIIITLCLLAFFVFYVYPTYVRTPAEKEKIVADTNVETAIAGINASQEKETTKKTELNIANDAVKTSITTLENAKKAVDDLVDVPDSSENTQTKISAVKILVDAQADVKLKEDQAFAAAQALELATAEIARKKLEANEALRLKTIADEKLRVEKLKADQEIARKIADREQQLAREREIEMQAAIRAQEIARRKAEADRVIAEKLAEEHRIIQLSKNEHNLVDLPCGEYHTNNKALQFYNGKNDKYMMSDIISSTSVGNSECDIKFTYNKISDPLNIEGTDYRRFKYAPNTSQNNHTWSMSQMGDSKSGVTVANKSMEDRLASTLLSVKTAQKNNGLIDLPCTKEPTKWKAKNHFNNKMGGKYTMGKVSKSVSAGDASCDMKFPYYDATNPSVIAGYDHRRFNFVPVWGKNNYTWGMGWMGDYNSGFGAS